MGGTFLCLLILRKIWSWIHWRHRCSSSEWDAINISPSIIPTLVLPFLYRHHTHCHVYLLTSSSAALTAIRVFFLSPSSRLSTTYLLLLTQSSPVSSNPLALPSVIIRLGSPPSSPPYPSIFTSPDILVSSFNKVRDFGASSLLCILEAA